MSEDEHDASAYPGRSRPAPRHGIGRASDMVRSLLVVAAMVGVVIVLVPRQQVDPVREVDVGRAAAQAAVDAPFPVVVPAGLTSGEGGWRATSAGVRTGLDGAPTWFLGYVTPDQAYVEVRQAAGDPVPLVAAVSRGGEPAGQVELAGDTWTRQVGASGEQTYRTLWRDAAGTTVVVAGTAPWAAVEQVAGALRPAS